MSEIKILTLENLEEILQFEKQLLQGSDLERELAAWQAPWRKEALEHYLPLGWSFVKKEDSRIVGYVLTQPILFFRSWTQTLWVEHLSAPHQNVGLELLAVIYTWARDKHLQKVYMNRTLPFASEINFCNLNKDEDFYYLNTTRV